METNRGGCTVFQRRIDGSVEFYLNQDDYVIGFGDVSGEYWLGLSNIHCLVNSNTSQGLRVEIEDFSGKTAYAKYSFFYIGGQSTDYTLHVTGYSGTAGDALAYQNGHKFTTKDNDRHSGYTCAVQWKGAWWYNHCHDSNLNGLYLTGGVINAEGICWEQWKGTNYSYKSAEMKVRPQA